MIWFAGILVVLALGAVAVVAAGHGGPLAPAGDDDPAPGLPEEGALSGADLRRVRFPLALRGYRMADVDALLDRLARERDTAPQSEPQSERQSERRPEPGTGSQPGAGSDPARDPGA